MFTGIIEDVGTIAALERSKVSILTSLDDIKKGDSVALNGICLTAVQIAPRAGKYLISFDYSPETARRTSLSGAGAGTRVNLERALKVGDRLGGHFLSGHVEGTGRLLARKNEGDAWMLRFSYPREINRYIASKGSIGVDGISLTVAEKDEESFTVAVIPHTMEHTVLRDRMPGDTVNLEPDILAKYVENMLAPFGQRKGLSLDTLRKNGFV